ncbi:ferritin [Candidatus Woesearchaeota archaeon]|nr:ferritin [Candidatus Woesearchaeota archaeon]
MAIPKNVLTALNKQINAEFLAAYKYLGMAAYFEDKNLPGMASWMHNQTKEELVHGMKFFDHIVDRGEKIVLDSIPKVVVSYPSALAVFEAAYKHEVAVTKMIHNLVETAKKANDHTVMPMLQWFLNEQIEEEKSTDEIVQKLKMVKSDSAALLMIDTELAKRKEA